MYILCICVISSYFTEMQAQLNEVKAALHKQTEIAVEQQRQIKESL